MGRRAPSPEAVLDECLSMFDPEVSALAVAALAWVRKLVPGSFELVYDAYNALSVPFAVSDRLGGAFVAVVVYPRYVNLGFNRGTELDDPERLLEGTGRLIRHVTIRSEKDLANPDLKKLVREAAEHAGYEKGLGGKLIIKKIYPRKRSRRPSSR